MKAGSLPGSVSSGVTVRFSISVGPGDLSLDHHFASGPAMIVEVLWQTLRSQLQSDISPSIWMSLSPDFQTGFRRGGVLADGCDLAGLQSQSQCFSGCGWQLEFDFLSLARNGDLQGFRALLSYRIG